MINIRPLIEQRIQAQVPAFKEVAGASDMATVLGGRLADPGCYVFQERVTPAANQSLADVLQAVTVQIGAIIVVRNVKDARGADAADASHGLQTSVQDALLNWAPHADYQALTYAGGVLISFSGGFYVWKDSFTSQTFIQY